MSLIIEGHGVLPRPRRLAAGAWTRAVVTSKDGLVVALFATLALWPWLRPAAAGGGRSGLDLGHMLSAPSAAHPLGTDNLGRDLLLRLSDALRGGVLPLWGGVLLGTALGLALAVLVIAGDAPGSRRAGRWGIWGADLLAATLASIPVGLVAFAWAAWQERAGLAPALGSLSVLFALRTYLQVRDLYRHDERLGYWTAHASLGGGRARRVWRYGLLGGWRMRLAQALSFHLRAAVAIEASLSYLGFGIQEPQASFGNMLASHFDLYLKGHWQVLAVIVAALAVTAALPGSLVALVLAVARRRKAPRWG